LLLLVRKTTPVLVNQVKYVVELAKTLGQFPSVARVDLLTRLIADPKARRWLAASVAGGASLFCVQNVADLLISLFVALIGMAAVLLAGTNTRQHKTMLLTRLTSRTRSQRSG
jgi:hypothetical protein